jgi:hypothetical protein
MANLVIVKTGNLIDVDFGNYAISSDVDGRKASYLVSDISIVWLEKDDSFVDVKMKDEITNNIWRLSFNSDSGVFVVDSIDGVAPTSNIDLYNKLNALR